MNAKTDTSTAKSINDNIQHIEEEEFGNLVQNLENSDLYFGGSKKIPDWLEEHLETVENGEVPSFAACLHAININDNYR